MLLVVGIIFISALIRSALGFGDAVVAMPLPAIVLGVILGGLLNKRIPHGHFARLVNGCLAAMGALLLLRTLIR